MDKLQTRLERRGEFTYYGSCRVRASPLGVPPMCPRTQQMKPNPELLAAYTATSYFADIPSGRVALRIGEPALELNDILIEHEVGSWAFITACNPMSKKAPEAANKKHLVELEDLLKDRELIYFPGEGIGDARAWPCEASFLILGINLDEGIDIARTFGQHAIVFGRFNKPAQLVWVNE